MVLKRHGALPVMLYASALAVLFTYLNWIHKVMNAHQVLLLVVLYPLQKSTVR
jgi:hypothetical protein